MSTAASAGDGRFFRRTGPHKLSELAAIAAGTLAEADRLAGAGERLFRGVAPLQAAGSDEIGFLENRRYTDLLASTQAGAVIVQPALAGRLRPGCVAILAAEPRIGWARVAAHFFPEAPPQPGRHPAAVIDPEAEVDATAEIGPLAVIAAGARIGPRCRIGPAVVVGAGVEIGPDCRIGAHVSLSHALVGARVNILPGARIGQEGFGFEPTPTGFLPVPQLGRVIIEDDVEIGANTTIDRGAGPDTVIGAGSRLDNLVQIAHNVQLGRCCVIAGQAGISGSTILEDYVQLGGQAGLTGHLRIGRGARLGAQAGVLANVAAGAEVVGSPAQPLREFFRHFAVLRRLVAQSERQSAERQSAERQAAERAAGEHAAAEKGEAGQ